MTRVLFALLLLGCDGFKSGETLRIERELREWQEPCADESTLLATTAGSPNGLKCPNKNHRMRVEFKTMATNEEAAALVFCECMRPDGGKQP